MKRISFPISLTLALAAVGGIAAADPVDIEPIARSVTYVKDVDLGNLPDVSTYTRKSGTLGCIEEVDKALASGLAPTTIVNIWRAQIPGATEAGGKWSAPLAAIKEYCTAVAGRAKTRGIVDELEGILSSATTLHQDYFVDDGDPDDNWYNLEAVAKKCQPAVDAALTAGLASSQPLDVRGKKITLAQASAVCEPLVAAVGKVQAKKLAEEDAKIAPFKKALKGDKMALVLSRGTDWYGKGCRLMTAAQMAKATTWYEILVDTNGIRPRWTTRAYKFKGDKRTGNKERSGWGNDAPSSGCP